MRAIWIDRCDRNLRQMEGLLARLGVAQRPQKGLPDAIAWAYAARLCAFCPATEACDAWLQGAGGDDYHRFCPNAGFFDREQRN